MASLMNDKANRIQKILERIDIPRSYYERAVDRYKSLSDWFCREESEIAQFKPVLRVDTALVDAHFPAAQDAVNMAFRHAFADA